MTSHPLDWAPFPPACNAAIATGKTKQLGRHGKLLAFFCPNVCLETYSSMADVASRECHLVYRGIVDAASCCGHGEVKHELQLDAAAEVQK